MPKPKLGAETPDAAPLELEAEELPVELPVAAAVPAATVPEPPVPTALRRLAQVPEAEGAAVTEAMPLKEQAVAALFWLM